MYKIKKFDTYNAVGVYLSLMNIRNYTLKTIESSEYINDSKHNTTFIYILKWSEE